MKIKIGFSLLPGGFLPTRATKSSAGWDVYSPEDVTIPAGGRVLIPAGFKVDIPDGFHIEVCSRSGLSIKHGVFVLNSPGIIDADYTDEVGVILFNAGESEYTVKRGDRIAQLILRLTGEFDIVELPEIKKEGRGGGFGSTG